MATVIPIGSPQNDDERRVIAYLRDNTPHSYLLLHNFELLGAEIDIALITPHGVFLVDVKGTKGAIDVHGHRWHPEHREPFTSPMLKLHTHAKRFKGLLVDKHHTLKKVFVEAAIVLSAEDVYFNDPDDRDGGCVVRLKQDAVGFFCNPNRVPENHSRDIRGEMKQVLKVIQSGAVAKTAPTVYGNWVIDDRLGGTDQYEEFRAHLRLAGSKSGRVNLKVYLADPYLEDAGRQKQIDRLRNAYDALRAMPPHPGIPAANEFGEVGEGERFYLVTDEAPGRSLRLHLSKVSLALTFEQKRKLVEHILESLAHAHAYKVIHRAISPSTIMWGEDGQARLVNFDYARTGENRSYSIAGEVVNEVEEVTLAPEVYLKPEDASEKSDVYSAGLVFYELYTGRRPFENLTEAFDQECVFPVLPSEEVENLPIGFDRWLQNLCAMKSGDRPSAREALDEFRDLFKDKENSGSTSNLSVWETATTTAFVVEGPDYKNLESNFRLTTKYIIEGKLGSGAFGTVYKAFDTLTEEYHALKIIHSDRISKVGRLLQEYHAIEKVPTHPHIVKMKYADFLPDRTPFISFEFVDGLNVEKLSNDRKLSLEDAMQIAQEVAEGLAHIHSHNVGHCDIKPANLLWTDDGVKIIDFNVALTHDTGRLGGSKKYLPPDYQTSEYPTPEQRSDRDLYALAITVYEIITGNYPWPNSHVPVPGNPPRNPRDFTDTDDLSDSLVDVLTRELSPKRDQRYQSATEFLEALQSVGSLRRATELPPSVTKDFEPPAGDPNFFLHYLLTLYSQSRVTNAGTRGLGEVGKRIYVDTRLDVKLAPEVLSGNFKLVVISGNAGDGKTAFLQKIEGDAKEMGAIVVPASGGNGAEFTLNGIRFLSNYDGSQDEGDKVNDAVLLDFLSPYRGTDAAVWPGDETRLIAINEGRLIDFLQTHEGEFPRLAEMVEEGLSTSFPSEGVAVVNLNLRSVVAGDGDKGSIMERLVFRLTSPKLWQGCDSCGLRDRCYVRHNVQTFQDKTGGAQVLDRLRALYMLTTLRGKLHITLRDLGSAIAYMLVGERNCDEIKELYESDAHQEILQGYYFNSWMGGDGEQRDRLLKLLQEIDLGMASDARLDRSLDYREPSELKGLKAFTDRGGFHLEILERMHGELPWEYGNDHSARFDKHRRYVSVLRRLHFFERRDDGWRTMLPYTNGKEMLDFVRGDMKRESALVKIIDAMNRSEGIFDPQRLGNQLALQVRHVDKGTIKSYRVFPGEGFQLAVKDDAKDSPFLEHIPTALVLKYYEEGEDRARAEMNIDLDIYEMLCRLHEGYRPTVEESQGYYISVEVFKNVLGSASYQEVLLTRTGHHFNRIRRSEDGVLHLENLTGAQG